MARTNPSDVASVFETDLETSENGPLSAWIDAASDLVDDIEAEAPETDENRLERIEKFYAAHLASAQDPRISQGSRESASISYGREGGSYKETAIALDPTNVIASASVHRDTGRYTGST